MEEEYLILGWGYKGTDKTYDGSGDSYNFVWCSDKRDLNNQRKKFDEVMFAGKIKILEDFTTISNKGK